MLTESAVPPGMRWGCGCCRDHVPGRVPLSLRHRGPDVFPKNWRGDTAAGRPEPATSLLQGQGGQEPDENNGTAWAIFWPGTFLTPLQIRRRPVALAGGLAGRPVGAGALGAANARECQGMPRLRWQVGRLTLWRAGVIAGGRTPGPLRNKVVCAARNAINFPVAAPRLPPQGPGPMIGPQGAARGIHLTG